MTISTKPSDREAIEALRAEVAGKAAAEKRKPTVDVVKTIVGDLRMCRPLADTANSIQMANTADAERFVLDVVATFGTWLSHSLGRAEVVATYVDDAEEQPALFHMTGDDDGGVKIPVGYEPWATHQRDVVKALSAILYHAPSDEVIARFVSRTYGARQTSLTYALVSGVWGFASRGRLDTVGLVSGDLAFQAHVVEAFDLLDVARADAVEAIIRLVTDDLDLEAALYQAQKCFWLAEAELGGIVKAIGLALSGKAPATVAQRAIDTLRRHVHAAPGRYLPGEVRDLTLGQVRRICAASGLKIEAETHSEEAEIRSTLKQMGLAADADRLVPQALRCAEHGDLDAFWTIMQSRIEGDLTWAEQLDELVEA